MILSELLIQRACPSPLPAFVGRWTWPSLPWRSSAWRSSRTWSSPSASPTRCTNEKRRNSSGARRPSSTSRTLTTGRAQGRGAWARALPFSACAAPWRWRALQTRSRRVGATRPGAAAVVSWPPGAVPHSAAPPQGSTTATTAGAAGCVQCVRTCVRASDPFYQWRDEKCHQHEGRRRSEPAGGAARRASECR